MLVGAVVVVTGVAAVWWLETRWAMCMCATTARALLKKHRSQRINSLVIVLGDAVVVVTAVAAVWWLGRGLQFTGACPRMCMSYW